MKKLYTLLCILVFQFPLFDGHAQAPQGIPYQAVARDVNGGLLASQNIALQFSIHDGNATGPVVYQETQNVTTNTLGLFSVNLGQGTAVSGTLATVNWGSGDKFLQVEMDPAGGTSYTDMGTTQLMSVPYALYAGNSSNGWSTTGNSGTNPLDNALGTNDSTDLVIKTDNFETARLFSNPETGGGLNTPTDRLRLMRSGMAYQKWPMVASFQLGSYEPNLEGRTQLDIALLNGPGVNADNKVMSLQANGNVGIGNTSPTERLDVNGIGKFGPYLKIGTDVAEGYFQNSQDGAYRSLQSGGNQGYWFQNYNGANTTMYVGLNGAYQNHVGIGNVTPQHTLSVGEASGDLQAVAVRGYSNDGNWKGGAAFGYNQGSVVMGELAGVPTIGGHNANLSAWNDLAINPDGGNVGIGTSNPTAKLDVNGTLKTNEFQMPTGAAFGKILKSDSIGNASWQNSDLSNLISAAPAGELCFQEAGIIHSGGQPYKVVVKDHYAFVANSAANTITVFDFSNPSAMTLSATLAVGSFPQGLAIAGNTLFVTNVNGANMSVVDISNPAGPSILTTVATGNGPGAIVIKGNYAYIANVSDNTIGIYDISIPASTSLVNSFASSTIVKDMAITGDYLCYVSLMDQAFVMFNITNPTSPVLTSVSAVYYYPIALAISGNKAYITRTVPPASNSMTVIDISNPSSPVFLGTADFGVYARSVAVAGNIVYVTGEDGVVKGYNVSDPANPTLMNTVSIAGAGTSLATKDNLIFVTLYNTDKFQILRTGCPQSIAIGVDQSVSLAPSLWVPNGDDMYNANTGNVGIGTSTPNRTLDVRGDIAQGQATDSIPSRRIGVMDASSQTAGMEIENTTLDGNYSQKLHFITNHNANGFGRRLTIDEDGNVGIATTLPVNKLTVAGSTNITGSLGIGIASSNFKLHVAGDDNAIKISGSGNLQEYGQLNFGDYNFVYLKEDVNDRLTIHANRIALDGGNVGIGIFNPLNKLSVTGVGGLLVNTTNSGSGSFDWIAGNFGGTAGNRVVMGLLGGNATIAAHNSTLSDYADLYINPEHYTGRVQIGNNGTVGLTHGKLNVVCSGNNIPKIAHFKNIANSGNWQYDGGIKIQAGNDAGLNGPSMIEFDTPNGLSIGSVTQTSSSHISYSTTSDRRLKENIHTTKFGLADLNKIEVRDYDYINGSKNQTGFIAQQLYEIYPSAVSKGGDDPTTHPWMVEYGGVTPLIVKSVQELSAQADEKNKEMELLKQQLEAQQKQIDELKGLLKK